MRLAAAILLAVAAIAAALPFLQPVLSLPEIPRPPFGRRPGEQHADFGIPLGSSVQGHHIASEVVAELQVFDRGARPDSATPVRVLRDLPFEARGNSEWGTTITVPDQWVTTPMYLTIRFDRLPDDPDLWGRPARVAAKGTVRYPEHAKTVTEPGGRRRGEFDEVTRPFEGAVTFSFMDRGESERFAIAWADYERARAGAESGLEGTIRRFMADSHPGLMKAFCWGLAAVAVVAAWRLEVLRRRRRARS